MSDHFPWYDAWWLARYVSAKDYIGQHCPTRLAEFLGALDPLRTRPDFQARLHHHLFTQEQFDTIRAAVRSIKPDALETHELLRHGRYVVHDLPMLADIHAAMAPIVSELVGEPVEPMYSFIALYNQNGVCPVHLDAPISKWTLDLCVEQSEPWPIAFSEVDPWPEEFDPGMQGWEEYIRSSAGHRFSSMSMEPGQAVVFSGSSQWHYREPLRSPCADSHCDLLFLHYITAGMKEVSEWKNWESQFRVPGLTEAIR